MTRYEWRTVCRTGNGGENINLVQQKMRVYSDGTTVPTDDHRIKSIQELKIDATESEEDDSGGFWP